MVPTGPKVLTTQAEVKEAWEAGKDFRIVSHHDRRSGTYMSIRNMESDMRVTIRFGKEQLNILAITE